MKHNNEQPNQLQPAAGNLANTQATATEQIDKGPNCNWSGNYQYSAAKLLQPRSLPELQEYVKSTRQLSALGSRHSFNDIADNPFTQISLAGLNQILNIDPVANTVTVEGGMRYGDLAPLLDAAGYALHNLASLPHITIAGAIATATHGSGITNGNLSTAVTAIEYINPEGKARRLQKQDGDLFNGAVIGLGALGPMSKITLKMEPAFDMKQVVYVNMPMEALADHFMDMQLMAYSVSFFTNWQNRNINEVWIKTRVQPGVTSALPAAFFGARAATRPMHPLEEQPAENCTEQLGIAGPWFERLPHFKMAFKPSAGAELQSEYFIPIEYAYEAMLALATLAPVISPHLYISEIRTICADNLWMSPCYGKTCVAFHTTWKPDQATVMQLLPLLEAALAPFKPLPHWGKLFTLAPAAILAGYPRLNDFRTLVKQTDPQGKFLNKYLRRIIFD